MRPLFAVIATLAALAGPAAAQAAAPAIHVEGNQIVDAAGHPLVLHGVNRDGAEWTCQGDLKGNPGYAFIDGPVDEPALAAIASWHATIVRVPLAEDCWLGINGSTKAYSGRRYRRFIVDLVNRLHAHGMVVILDLHTDAPGRNLAQTFQVMADADHAPAFWASVAKTFRGDHSVIFDLFNEPHQISWSCWQHGCTQRKVDLDHGRSKRQRWRTASMQQLLAAVRRAGAHQPVMVGGLDWSSDLSQLLRRLPADPDHQVIASFHTYNFAGCNELSCWDGTLTPVAARIPLIAGELGEDDCQTAYVNRFMDWADAHRVGYLGWAWNTGGGWTCKAGPTLITDYDGTPSGMGVAIRDRLAGFATG